MTSIVLAPDCRRSSSATAGVAVVGRESALFLVPVFRVTDVPNTDRRVADLGDDQIVELPRIRKSAEGAQHEFARAFVDAAAGDFRVLPRDRIAHLDDRNLVRRQPVSVDPHD